MALKTILYLNRLNAYNCQTKDYYIEQNKQLILDGFDVHPSYQDIVVDGVSKGVHIVSDSALDSNPNKKTMLLQPDESLDVGSYLEWASKDWIIYDKDDNRDIQDRVEIYRCNNNLIWIDENGATKNFPCIVNTTSKSDSGIKESKNIRIIDKDIEVKVQKNEHTSKLIEGKRFIFEGQVYELGLRAPFVKDGIIFMYMDFSERSVYDNFELSIANYYEAESFTIFIEEGNINISIDGTIQLNAVVKDGEGKVVEKDITWSSSSVAFATVNSSGLLTAIADGVAVITAKLTGNNSVSNTISATVTPTILDNFEIILTPNTDIVRLSEVVDFNVQLLNNGIDTGDTFAISIIGGTASSTDYDFEVVDDNNFKITNKNDGGNLIIRCQSGTHILDKTIDLVWLYV